MRQKLQSWLCFVFEVLAPKISYEKRTRKTLMKLTQGVSLRHADIYRTLVGFFQSTYVRVRLGLGLSSKKRAFKGQEMSKKGAL